MFRSHPRKLIRSVIGLTIYRKLPIGLDPFYDIKRKLPNKNFQTFFDVGANIGQSAHEMRRFFPKADIHCLEPVKETFFSLKKNTDKLNVNTYNVALGSKNEKLKINLNSDAEDSDRNSFVSQNVDKNSNVYKSEEVQVLTLRNFCEIHRIPFIDYLKIDTEGFDLEVLKGATELLEAGSVTFVEAEVSMNPKNTYHIDFTEIKSFLEKYGYLLFGIYEQIHERRNKIPMMRRSNVLFISGNIKIT